MSTQKTREELPDRIDSKRRTKPCGVSRLKIRTWGIDYAWPRIRASGRETMSLRA